MAANALASIQEDIKKELANVRNTVAPPSSNNISLKGKVFSLPDGTSDQGPIKAVILDHRNFNRYYTAAYNPNDPKPPSCFAISKSFDGMAPHEDASDPQSEACKTCDMNKWGSASQGKGKACRNTVRLAVATIDAKPEDDPMIITISPTGLKSWSKLVNDLEQSGMLPIQVITEIAFDPNQAFPTLLFKALKAHDNLEDYWKLREKAQVLLDQPPIAD